MPPSAPVPAPRSAWIGTGQIREPPGVGRTMKISLRDSLQDLELPYDDGTAVDEEPALVASAEPAGLAAGENRRRGRRAGHESPS